MRIERPLRRGQIWWVNWEPHRGSEQGGRRPALIVQADAVNILDEYENTIVLALSTKGRDDLECHVGVEPSQGNGLTNAGFVKCEQIMTISRARLDGFIGALENRYMQKVDGVLADILSLR